MLIETSDVIYETFFQHAQLEITGRCNMRCEHCRAWNEKRIDMPLRTVKKILEFATSNSESDFRLTISGGEPFLHHDLVDIIYLAKEMRVENVIITTNGSLVTNQKIAELESVGLNNLCIQVSIDSIDPQRHDTFRSYKGAFEKAVDCLKRVTQSKLIASSRATVTPTTLNEVEKIVQLAKICGATRVGIGSVIPVGKGSINKELLMTSTQKKKFLEIVSGCKKKYTEINVTTEDPLKFAIPGKIWDYGNFDYTNSAFFGGCTAGVTGFNADNEGTITPCATLLKPIVNVQNKTTEEILKEYTSSEIIRNLIARKFSGKCGKCKLRRLCGGCRAVAEGTSGDYLSSDITCWRA